jgi:hypothetical protein
VCFIPYTIYRIPYIYGQPELILTSPHFFESARRVCSSFFPGPAAQSTQIQIRPQPQVCYALIPSLHYSVIRSHPTSLPPSFTPYLPSRNPTCRSTPSLFLTMSASFPYLTLLHHIYLSYLLPVLHTLIIFSYPPFH